MTMERIRKALEKVEAGSRPSRAVDAPAAPSAPAAPTAVSAPQRARTAGLELDDIVYSRTKVAKLGRRKASRNRLIAAAGDPRAAAFQVLRTRLLHQCRQRSWRTIGITSIHSGAGKTFAAANLAVSIAREPNQTVLLADFDLRHPRLAKMFGYRSRVGLRDCLARDLDVGEILFNPGIERLVILPGAGGERNAAELLAAPATRRLVREMVSRYESRLILCDLAPLTASDDVLVCLPYLDAVILVIEYGKTSRSDIEHGLELLKGTPIAATILNKVRHPGKPDEYYDYAYR